jgi:hypothetical protein
MERDIFAGCPVGTECVKSVKVGEDGDKTMVAYVLKLPGGEYSYVWSNEVVGGLLSNPYAPQFDLYETPEAALAMSESMFRNAMKQGARIL